MSRLRFWMIVVAVGLAAGLAVGVVGGPDRGVTAGFVAAFGVIVFHARMFSRPSELGRPPQRRD